MMICRSLNIINHAIIIDIYKPISQKRTVGIQMRVDILLACSGFKLFAKVMSRQLAASQLPEREPIDVDDAPAPAC